MGIHHAPLFYYQNLVYLVHPSNNHLSQLCCQFSGHKINGRSQKPHESKNSGSSQRHHRLNNETASICQDSHPSTRTLSTQSEKNRKERSNVYEKSRGSAKCLYENASHPHYNRKQK